MAEHNGTRNGGARVFRELAGPGATPPWEVIGDLAPALGEHIEHGLGTLIGGTALDLRTREIATVCMLAAIGGCDGQLAFHAAGALRAGATAGEVVAAIEQVSLYAGIPRALNALAVVRGVLAGQPASAN